jgi:hypothetical protein
MNGELVRMLEEPAVAYFWRILLDTFLELVWSNWRKA